MARRKRSPQDVLEELAAHATPSSQRKFILKHRSFLRPEVISQASDIVREKIRVNVQQALRLAEGTVILAQNLGNKESLAIALRAKANALYAQGKYPSAVDLHEQAAALFEAAGNDNEMARTLSTSIQPLLLAGQYNRAFAAAERARAIFAKQRNTWRLARLEINVGNIYYRQDRFAEALDCYQRAHEALPPENDPEGVAAVLSNIATCYISLNDFPRALAAYQQARQFCEAHAMPLLVAQADYNVAYLHYLRGEYSKAIELLRATRAHSNNVGDTYHSALCNLDLAELYLELNLSAEAADLAHQGYESFCQLGMGYESAKCLAFSAMAASQQGQAFAALEKFSQAQKIFIKEKNRVWPSLIDLYRALVFFNEKRFFEARHHCADALDSFRKLALGGKEALAELLLVRISLSTADWAQALLQVQSALQKVEKLDAPPLSYQANFLAGNVCFATKDREQAYAYYQKARQSLETLRGRLRGEELKIAFLKNRTEVYENLIDLCLARQGGATAVEEAFNYVEQAKSRSLMDLFARPASTLSQTVSVQHSELVRSMHSLREELNWYYNRIEREQLRPEEQSPKRIEALRQQAREGEKELVRMLQEASEAELDEAGLQTPTHVPLPTIRESISEDTVVVEYFMARDRILVSMLGRKMLQILPITLEARIANLLRLLQFQLSKFNLNPEYITTFGESLMRATQVHLKELYNELIAPMASKLKAEHLVFVPHGILHYVPFHALFDGSEYLIDRHTISYSPSASIYSLCQSRTAEPSQRSLILGIPDAQAPAIADEVKALAGVLTGAEVFIGENASARILREKGPASRLVHIATHGRFRQDNPMFSSIRLGDCFLSLFDLYQLRLPVELITLSGCSTGLNVVAAGDELIGLSRGFLHAGAQSLMLSLWNVHDKSTAEFMTAFYTLLQRGKTKVEALRAAMLRLRDIYPHCYYWAPFTLVGRA